MRSKTEYAIFRAGGLSRGPYRHITPNRRVNHRPAGDRPLKVMFYLSPEQK